MRGVSPSLHILATLSVIESFADKIVLIKCQKMAGHVKENINAPKWGVLFINLLPIKTEFIGTKSNLYLKRL